MNDDSWQLYNFIFKWSFENHILDNTQRCCILLFRFYWNGWFKNCVYLEWLSGEYENRIKRLIKIVKGYKVYLRKFYRRTIQQKTMTTNSFVIERSIFLHWISFKRKKIGFYWFGASVSQGNSVEYKGPIFFNLRFRWCGTLQSIELQTKLIDFAK